jgi:hypothetical protein
LASPILPPGLQTLRSSWAAFSLIGGEHYPERGEHHVEGCVGVGQVLRVADLEGDIEALGPRAPPCLLDELRNVVYAGRHAGATGCGYGGVAGAGRDVEDLLAGTDIDRLTQAFPHDDQQVADPGVIARGPHLLLASLDGRKVRGLCWRHFVCTPLE